MLLIARVCDFLTQPRLRYSYADHALNPLQCKGNYSATSNTIKLVRWPLTCGLLHLVQRGGDLVGLQSTALCIRRTRTRTLCIRQTLCRHVTIGTPMVIFAVLTVFWLFLTIGTLLVQFGRLVTIGTPMVLYTVPIVKNSQKTVKTAKMTIGVPIVTCLHRVRRIHKAQFTHQRPMYCTNHRIAV